MKDNLNALLNLKLTANDAALPSFGKGAVSCTAAAGSPMIGLVDLAQAGASRPIQVQVRLNNKHIRLRA